MTKSNQPEVTSSPEQYSRSYEDAVGQLYEVLGLTPGSVEHLTKVSSLSAKEDRLDRSIEDALRITGSVPIAGIIRDISRVHVSAIKDIANIMSGIREKMSPEDYSKLSYWYSELFENSIMNCQDIEAINTLVSHYKKTTKLPNELDGLVGDSDVAQQVIDVARKKSAVESYESKNDLIGWVQDYALSYGFPRNIAASLAQEVDKKASMQDMYNFLEAWYLPFENNKALFQEKFAYWNTLHEMRQKLNPEQLNGFSERVKMNMDHGFSLREATALAVKELSNPVQGGDENAS